jgi:hypothetical protein
MSNWWADKLGTPRQPQQQPQQPRLPEQQVPVVQPGMTPQYPGYTPNQGYPPVTQQPTYNPELAGHTLPASATDASRCPNCSSGNYGKMPSMPEAKARCYDCGYPIQQSGSGMPGVRVPTNGNTQAAKQLSTQNNFNPGTIVDRIG